MLTSALLTSSGADGPPEGARISRGPRPPLPPPVPESRDPDGSAQPAINTTAITVNKRRSGIANSSGEKRGRHHGVEAILHLVQHWARPVIMESFFSGQNRPLAVSARPLSHLLGEL